MLVEIIANCKAYLEMAYNVYLYTRFGCLLEIRLKVAEEEYMLRDSTGVYFVCYVISDVAPRADLYAHVSQTVIPFIISMAGLVIFHTIVHESSDQPIAAQITQVR